MSMQYIVMLVFALLVGMIYFDLDDTISAGIQNRSVMCHPFFFICLFINSSFDSFTYFVVFWCAQGNTSREHYLWAKSQLAWTPELFFPQRHLRWKNFSDRLGVPVGPTPTFWQALNNNNNNNKKKKKKKSKKIFLSFFFFFWRGGGLRNFFPQRHLRWQFFSDRLGVPVGPTPTFWQAKKKKKNVKQILLKILFFRRKIVLPQKRDSI